MNVSRRISVTFLISIAGFGLAAYLTPYIYSVYNHDYYLGVHTLLELVSIIISFSLCLLVWLTRGGLEDSFGRSLIILGMSFFAVGWIDLGHMLSYQGMPAFFTSSSTQVATFLWLAARYTVAAAVTLALFRPLSDHTSSRKLAALTLAASTAITIVTFVVATRFIHLVPPLFIPGQGLTPVKIGAEYVLIAIYTFTLAVLWWKRYELKDSVNLKLSSFLVLTICSEIAFTFYDHIYDTYNLLGHIYKIIAYGFLFHAIYISGIIKHFYNLSEMASMSAELLKESISLDPFMEIQTKRLRKLLPQAERISYYITLDKDYFEPGYRWGKYSELFPADEHVYIKDFEGIFGTRLYIFTEPNNVLAKFHPYGYTPAVAEVFRVAHQMMYLPLYVDGIFYGFILAYIFDSRNSFYSEDVEKAELFQKFSSLAIAHVKNHEIITKLSYEDGLTGLPNRRFFFEELNRTVHETLRYGSSFTVAYIDMNNLKYINDTFGHNAGDEALLATARLIKGLIRKSDIPARLGGDEFALILRYMTAEEAAVRILELKNALRAVPLESTDHTFSLSIGSASFPEEGSSINELLRLADDRMYRNKREMKETDWKRAI